jgi:hypothetical protein
LTLQDISTDYQDKLNNLGLGSNDLRSEMNLLSNKLAMAKSSSELETIEILNLDSETSEASTNLDDADYSDSSFGGAYSTAEEYKQITVELENGIDLSQYDMENGSLKFELYLEKANLFEDFNAELGNIQDVQEIQWTKKAFPWIVDGWNEIRMSIGRGIKTGEIDWQDTSHFRLYFKLKGENKVRIKNIKVEAQKKKEANSDSIFVLDGGTIKLDSMENQNTLILALDEKASDMNTKINNQQELINSIQSQVDNINSLNSLNSAKVEANSSDISFIKSVLGLDRVANAGDVDILGKLSAEKTESGQMLIKVSDEAKRTIGASIITPVEIDTNEDGIDDETGSDGKRVFVETIMANPQSKIFVTSKKATDQNLSVTSIVEKEGFWVEVRKPVTEDLPFDWWMVEESNIVTP